MADDPQKVVEEYKFMLEKSQSFFAGLRDLPQYENKQWQLYFQKTFEIYTKLWKFQQEKRTILENKEYYGLKRWEIGEIASKIGQLYYHYYLRTSEALYLQESFVFYDAIRARFYFKDIVDANSAPLMIKKLRYYARFVVVCLLLDRRDYVQDLLRELDELVKEYDRTFNPPDSSEWHLVVRELGDFLKADDLLEVVGIDGRPKPLPLIETEPIVDAAKVELQHVVLVGNCEQQIKFSELTLDIFRILLTIETPVSADSKKQNPHKHLLYRPGIGQLHVVLASISKDLADGAALLVYLSADKWTAPTEPPAVACTVPQGGLALNARGPDQGSSKPAGVFPEDLLPWTRQPFVVIVDSPGSSCFMEMKNVFGAPLLCLLSPETCPPAADIPGPSVVGNLFTLFLNSPLIALWVSLKQDGQMEKDNYEAAEAKITDIMQTIKTKLLAAGDLDNSIKLFMTDELLCNMITRFVFFETVVHLHSSFKGQPECAPKSNPPMPAVSKDEQLIEKVMELAELLGDTECMQNS